MCCKALQFYAYIHHRARVTHHIMLNPDEIFLKIILHRLLVFDLGNPNMVFLPEKILGKVLMGPKCFWF